MYIKNKKLG